MRRHALGPELEPDVWLTVNEDANSSMFTWDPHADESTL